MAQGKKTGGRTKGTPNKTTGLLKEAVLLAAEQADPEGTVGYLRRQANENPAAFMTLLGKIMPTQITGKDEGPIQTEDVSARELLISRVVGLSARSGATPKTTH